MTAVVVLAVLIVLAMTFTRASGDARLFGKLLVAFIFSAFVSLLLIPNKKATADEVIKTELQQSRTDKYQSLGNDSLLPVDTVQLVEYQPEMLLPGKTGKPQLIKNQISDFRQNHSVTIPPDKRQVENST